MLTYRGIAYYRLPYTLETVSTGIKARYRGLAYEIHRPVQLPRSVKPSLTYRGVSYGMPFSAVKQPSRLKPI